MFSPTNHRANIFQISQPLGSSSWPETSPSFLRFASMDEVITAADASSIAGSTSSGSSIIPNNLPLLSAFLSFALAQFLKLFTTWYSFSISLCFFSIYCGSLVEIFCNRRSSEFRVFVLFCFFPNFVLFGCWEKVGQENEPIFLSQKPNQGFMFLLFFWFRLISIGHLDFARAF